MKLPFLDALFLLVTVRHRKHLVHGRNQESRRAARRVEHHIVRLDIHQITHKVSDMSRRQDDTQRLPVAARITHELAVEATNEILGSLPVLDVLKHMLIQEFRVKLERRFTKLLVDLVQSETGLQNSKLSHKLIFLCIWPYV